MNSSFFLIPSVPSVHICDSFNSQLSLFSIIHMDIITCILRLYYLYGLSHYRVGSCGSGAGREARHVRRETSVVFSATVQHPMSHRATAGTYSVTRYDYTFQYTSETKLVLQLKTRNRTIFFSFVIPLVEL